jgi:hypothetical protein
MKRRQSSTNNINGIFHENLSKGKDITKSVLIENLITDGNTTQETTAPISR